jgi:hypothetical protein
MTTGSLCALGGILFFWALLSLSSLPTSFAQEDLEGLQDDGDKRSAEFDRILRSAEFDRILRSAEFDRILRADPGFMRILRTPEDPELADKRSGQASFSRIMRSDPMTFSRILRGSFSRILKRGGRDNPATSFSRILKRGGPNSFSRILRDPDTFSRILKRGGPNSFSRILRDQDTFSRILKRNGAGGNSNYNDDDDQEQDFGRFLRSASFSRILRR